MYLVQVLFKLFIFFFLFFIFFWHIFGINTSYFLIKYVEECNKVLEGVNIPIELAIQNDNCIVNKLALPNKVKLIEDLFNIEGRILWILSQSQYHN